jgi:RNA polymerase sigma factor (sigma-70 family)
MKKYNHEVLEQKPVDQLWKNNRDEEILSLSLQKPSAFEMLVDRYQDGFLRTAMRVINQKEEAEDIVQEVFTKIYLNARKFKEIEGGSFKSWAYKILINTSLTHYKKQKKLRESFKDIEPEFYESMPDTQTKGAEEEADVRLLVEQVLLQMPKHLQSALRKYYLEDRSQKDIAEEEGISITAVKMRLFRAKKMFKNFLRNNNYQY